MEIKWIGHSCFLIKNLLGKKVLIDPMQIYPYIQKYDLKADIITLSHSHNNEFINDCLINNNIIIIIYFYLPYLFNSLIQIYFT